MYSYKQSILTYTCLGMYSHAMYVCIMYIHLIIIIFNINTTMHKNTIRFILFVNAKFYFNFVVISKDL